MSGHVGVSCDACGKSNFRSKRFKCLICYDYDLCSICHEQGKTSSDHTAEHPMQCILTRQDFDLYYHGERCPSEQPQSLTCPFCGDMGLSLPFLNESSSLNNGTQNVDLLQHLQIKHTDDQQSIEVLCPICAAMANSEPNLVTADLISHITNDHQHSQVNTPPSTGGGINVYSRQSSSTRDYDFGAGVRGGFRRGPLRTPGRRGGRGGGPVSQHFAADTSSGVPPIGGGNDPIADLLTQLSSVRRLAAAHNNGTNDNFLSTSSNTINLQTLTRQQYDRERLRASIRSHHQPSNDIVPSVESDFFDSLFTSTLFIDPSTSSSNNHQTWTQIVAQQQQPPPQSSPTTKTPVTTNTEPDPSLLRRMFNEVTSSLTHKNTTKEQQQNRKNDFVHSLLLSSFTYSIHDNDT